MSQNHNTAWALRKFAPNRWRVELSSAAWPGLLLCLLAMTLGAASGQSAMAAEPPNIVFMLSDDQGWSGLSVAMHPDVPGSRGEIFHTPALEKLAAQGLRFSSAYAPAPVCSPTRASLLTGKNPARLHWTKAAPPEAGHRLIEPRLNKRIPESERTVAECLQQAGYATAHYGKWHLGSGGPGAHGYDEHDGDTGNEQAFKFKDPNPVDIFGMAGRAEAFMKRNAEAGKPFFIQLSWNALHASENARPATLAKYAGKVGEGNRKRETVAAITEDLDEGVGRVLESIDRLGLADRTYVIYMSDNGSGGGGRRDALRGGKGGVWEGGIRVPLIMRGPGIESNSWCHVPVVGYDLFPTFLEWAGVAAADRPAGLEGGSLAALIRSPTTEEVHRPRPELVFHFPHYQSSEGPQTAIRVGDWKLMHFYEDGHDELYHLGKDLAERRDLSKEQPAETQRLRRQLDDYLALVEAQKPTRNPDFDPSTPAPARRRGGQNRKNRQSD
ncbi:MAG: sulfatase [Planctomycetaceae bacterium]